MDPRLFIKLQSKAIYCSNLKPSTYATCYLFELCQIVVTLLRDAFHTPMNKITYTPHIFANFYTGSCASIPQNKNSILFIAILSKLKGHGLVKKWTHEGPKHSKEKEKKFGHMKVQCVSKES